MFLFSFLLSFVLVSAHVLRNIIQFLQWLLQQSLRLFYMSALFTCFKILCLSTVASTLAADGRCPIVIDVRTQLEWDAGHAPCAHRLEIQNDPTLVTKVLSLAKGDLNYPVQVYCRSGFRAGKAKKLLQDQKWTAVSNAGGWESGQVDAIKKLCDCEKGATGKTISTCV